MDASSSATAVRQILLVGVDPARAAEFGLAAADPAGGWRITLAKSAAEAYERLEKDPAQIVVTPVWLAESNGVDFLDTVMARWPDTIRILLSDSTLVETTVRGLGKAHHHLLEPSDATTLLDLFRRIEAFRSNLHNPKLAALVARMPQLPSPPEIYFQVLEEVRASEASIERVGKLIVQDPPLSAKVLQLANSAVFGLHLQVVHPVEAVAYVGIETTKALLLLAHTFSYFEQVNCPNFSLPSMQYHALAVGRYAQRISEPESAPPEIQSEAFTAGLLHDLGKLFLAANLPEEFSQVLMQCLDQDRLPSDLETEILGANHAELGGYILDTWHLPNRIVEAVTWHHDPLQCPNLSKDFLPLTAVHAANAIEHDCRADFGTQASVVNNGVYFKAMGLSNRWNSWCEGCLNPSVAG